MKILIVSQYFWPENFRINDLCSALTQRGHEVTVLTAQPNYPDGKIFSEFKNKPREFDNYKGCDIVRVPIFPRGNGSSIKLALNYVSFAICASTIGLIKIRKKKFDVVFVCQLSPVTIALPAIFYKFLYNKKIVMWVLDLWPDSLVSVNATQSPSIIKLVGMLVKFIYKKSDLILGQSRSFRKSILRYCSDENKVKYYPSWSEEIFSGKDKSKLTEIVEISKHEGFFKVLFAGNVGDAQDFPSIIKAAEILKSKNFKVKIFVVGSGRLSEWLKKEVVNLGLTEYIHLLGRHPIEMMPSYFFSADALLVSLKKDPAFSITIPGKVQSYLESGKPILGMLDGEGKSVLEESGSAYVCASGDFFSLANNMVNMSLLSKNERDLMSNNARRYSSENFNRDLLVSRLEEWFYFCK